MHHVRIHLRTAYTRLAQPGRIRSAPGAHFLDPAPRARQPWRRFSFSASHQARLLDVSVSAKRLHKSPTRSVLVVLLLLGAGLTAALHYGYIKIEMRVERDGSPAAGNPLDNAAPPSADEIALRTELARYLRQALFYLDKDLEEAFEALKRVLRFIDQHPDLLDPDSTPALIVRDNYVTILAENPSNTDFLREINVLIDACRRRLKEYDQQGILNTPLQRDLPILMEEQVRAAQGDLGETKATEHEERKLIFQILFGEYRRLIQFYLSDDSPIRNDAMADETIEHLLSALEAEFGSSFGRAPMQRRAGSTEIDKWFIYDYLNMLRLHFEPNTKPTYSPELALKCLRPIAELMQSFEATREFSPCLQIYTLQCIANLVLDLACESTPKGLLTTDGDRHHLEEAKRVQQRVLQLDAAIDPTKRINLCDIACVEGLISMAKIAWRFGDESTGDQELEKAARLVPTTNSHLLKEVIRRIDKDPSKTAMKHWEPVTAEECSRLNALDADDDGEDPREEMEKDP